MNRFALAVLGLAVTGRAAAVTFTPLGAVPGQVFYSEALGVSADGSTIVGSAAVFDGENWSRPVRWVGDVIEVLQVPAGISQPGQGLGISDDGSVVAGSFDGQAFRWTQAGGMELLGSLSTRAPYSGAAGVSGDGKIVFGTTNDATGAVAFRWSAATGMTSLGRLPSSLPGGSYAYASNEDGSVIVGSAEKSGISPVAVVWRDGAGPEPLPLPAGNVIRTNAADISGRFIAGSAGFGPFPEVTSAVVWDLNGEFLPRILASPDGARQSGTFAISADGVVAGGQSITGNDAVAMLWDMAGNIYRLDALLTTAGLDVDGWKFYAITGISEDGRTLVGAGLNPQNEYEAWVVRDFAMVPEPQTAALVSLSVFVWTFRRRYRSA